jgi:hypothetical protein
MTRNTQQFVLAPFHYSHEMERNNHRRRNDPDRDPQVPGDEIERPYWSNVTGMTLGPASRPELERWLRDHVYVLSEVFGDLWLSSQHSNVAFMIQELSPLPEVLQF